MKIKGLPDRTHTFKKPNYRNKLYGYDIACYSGDLKFIQDNIRQASRFTQMSNLIHRYSECFKRAYNSETNEAAKENTARRVANTKLREFVENKGKL